MKLFVKIFPWFLAATALMVGVIVIVTRTFQTEPLVNRFQRSTRNQMAMVFYSSVLAIPLLIVIAGVSVWWKRR